MRLPEDDLEEFEEKSPYSLLRVTIAILLLITLALVLWMVGARIFGEIGGNLGFDNREESVQQSALVETGTLLPEDLDFWDKYPEESSEQILQSMPVESSEEKEEEDPATDGRHTLVVHSDGEEEWLLINQYLPKNEFDYTKLVCQSQFMKYYDGGKLVSFVGADISKYQGNVDFVKLKNAGVDFVMLRVGARGYSTGQIVLDDYFRENLRKATEAGLQIGVYFSSQAITQAEAEEEAIKVVESLAGYSITYPVVFTMERLGTDYARTDSMTKTERTYAVRSFVETIKNYGYTPMIGGEKEWLLCQMDLTKLYDYDLMLSQEGDIPDFPYRFGIWKYNNSGKVDGVETTVPLLISFIDYTEK